MENIALKEKPPKQITREELVRHEQALERCCPHLWASAARADSHQAWTRAYDQLATLESYLRQISVVPAAEAVADLKNIASARAANAGSKAV